MSHCQDEYNRFQRAHRRSRRYVAAYLVGACLTFGWAANNIACPPESPCKLQYVIYAGAWPIYWPLKLSVILFDPTAKFPIPKVRFEPAALVS